MTFEHVFMLLWILSVCLEIWLFFLLRRQESYIEVQSYVLFCLCRAVVLGGLIPYCRAYQIVFHGFQYFAVLLKILIFWGGWRSRRDPIWRGMLFGLFVGAGAEAAGRLLKDYLGARCGTDVTASIDVVERVFFCLMLSIWIEVFWKFQRERKGERLLPKEYA
jgi:hypothetical protein